MDRSTENRDTTLIMGVGSALVDILLQETDEFLAETGGQKGGMTLVDAKKIDEILSRSSKKPAIVPGGSSCNTIIGIGRLGGRASFLGKRGNDDLGILFENELKKNNVTPVLKISSSPTGRVLSVITPDAQRTMFTHLGASSEAKPEEMTPERFKEAYLVHIEGYLLFNPELITATIKAAKTAGARISLDLASYTVVEASKDILKGIVKNYVDIILANEDEARAYTGLSDEMEALKSLSKEAEIAVVKVGKRGSHIAYKDKIHSIGIKGSGYALDTTGAGDLWASGFLFGLAQGMTIEECGKLGSACGFEVCQITGASIPDKGWERIKKML